MTVNRQSRGPSCRHGYTVYGGKHPDGKPCEDNRERALRRIVEEDGELLDRLSPERGGRHRRYLPVALVSAWILICLAVAASTPLLVSQLVAYLLRP